METYLYATFEFEPSVPSDAIADTLEVAVAAVRGDQGQTAVLLEAEHRFDPERRMVTIAAEAPAGRGLARVFHGLASRSFGAGSIHVSFARESR